MHDHRKTDLREQRIAIIGGGVSGLTAAYKLHKKGFRNVTLYEAGQRLGGKVRTVEIDGQVIEIGALRSAKNNPTMFAMGRDLGVRTARRAMPKILVLWTRPDGTREQRLLDRYWGGRSIGAVVRGFVQFAGVVLSPKFRPLFKPGLATCHADLAGLSMTEFAQKFRFDAIVEPFHVVIHSCGYGALDDIAALYFLKFFKCLSRLCLRRQVSFGLHPGVYTFRGGFQGFWETVGARLAEKGVSLRLGSPVTRVVRRTVENGQAEIAVTVGDEVSLYDRLLVSSPPDETLKFIDATDEERDLFRLVSYLQYHTIVFRTEGIKDNRVMALRYNMDRHHDGHMFCHISDWPGSNLFLGYQFNGVGRSKAELDELIRQDIADLGGTVTEIVLRTPWKYFPHVKLENLDEQYYPRLNALQGQQDTYYLGSLFAFETVDFCAEFAAFVVDKYFK